MTNKDASHPDVIFEMMFTNFLFHAASPDIYMLYSANYRVMESIAKVWKSVQLVYFYFYFILFLFIHSVVYIIHFLYYFTNIYIACGILQLSKQTTWRRFRIIEPMLANAKLPQDSKLKQPAPGITLAHPGVSMQVYGTALLCSTQFWCVVLWCVVLWCVVLCCIVLC